ncbi:hypothetical protein FQR65_LT06088 [Abscondita terminalis]|nr:hypothetical protein FQR65_LT06088 [Abscondita terminalis]
MYVKSIVYANELATLFTLFLNFSNPTLLTIMDISVRKNCVTDKINSFKNFLTSHKNNKEHIQLFIKNTPIYICDIIEKLKDFCDASNASKHEKFLVFAYLSQYCTLYEFLKKTHCDYKNDTDVDYEIVQSVLNQLFKLCEKIESLFIDDCEENTVGSFIRLMDLALQKIEEININNKIEQVQYDLDVAAAIVEEILCFSMSVAQVGSNIDKKVVTGSCQVVLNNIESLKLEVGKEKINFAMCSLLIETYSNSLCALEAKVNLVVLNLCLGTFPNYRSHVHKLYDACLEITNKTALDFVTSNFDIHMDRLFQIGLFSLSCSSVSKRSVEIKVLLANLQFLESELVPAFMAMTTSSSKHRKTYANIFKRFWCLQVKNLRNAVHNIIEPVAYCKLVFEELNQHMECLWNQISKGNIIIQKDMVEPFLNYTKELGTMIKTCLNSFEPDDKEQISKKLQVVYAVMQELEITTNVFLVETLNNTTTAATVNEKVFKRCNVLVKCIQKLYTCVKKDQNDSNNFSDEDSERDIEENDHLKSIVAKSQQIVRNRTITLQSKINFSTNASRMARSKRHLTFKDSFLDSGKNLQI